jgi:SsrA-binding protein
MATKVNIINTNRKARFSYTLSSFFVCGIQLKGGEIKSIRAGEVNINEAYCILTKNELWIKNMDINQYKFDHDQEYNPKRLRKLLLNKKEIEKIKKNLEEKGMTVVPTKLIISEDGFAKLEIGLGKGKKNYDKRETLKKRDAELEMHRKKREK